MTDITITPEQFVEEVQEFRRVYGGSPLTFTHKVARLCLDYEKIKQREAAAAVESESEAAVEGADAEATVATTESEAGGGSVEVGVADVGRDEAAPTP